MARTAGHCSPCHTEVLTGPATAGVSDIVPGPLTKALLRYQNQTKLEGHGRENIWLREEKEEMF